MHGLLTKVLSSWKTSHEENYRIQQHANVVAKVAQEERDVDIGLATGQPRTRQQLGGESSESAPTNTSSQQEEQLTQEAEEGLSLRHDHQR